MERKSYIYKITCKITGEYYFGSSFNAKRDWYWGGGKRIRERISQYGKENFIKEILEEFDDRTIAHQVENDIIEKFRHDDKCLNERIDYHFGTYSDKSRAKLSVAHSVENLSEETRSKISAALHGKTFSDEHKAKIGVAHRGKHHTDETKAKIGVAHRGKHHTEETKQKIREYRRGRTPWNKGKKLNKETGKYE